MKSKPLILPSLALALSTQLGAAPGDYSPTSPVRPSTGYLNDYLRKEDPYMAAWDVGMQVRLRYEIRDNFGIAGSPGSLDFRENGAEQDNAYLLHRIKPRIGYNSQWYSFMVEGRSSGSSGDKRNPNPEADNPIDLHQAYFVLGNHKEFPVSLKLGRQELSYGDERVIGAFNWNNLGRVFDAAKVRWQNPYFSADFFTSRLVIPDDNNFNRSNDDDYFSGIYASTKLIPKQTTELYLLSRNAGVDASTHSGVGTPALINGPAPRDIYTLGLRMKSTPGEIGNWDYTTELMAQTGHFNDPALPAPVRSLDHEAYAVVLLGGYTWTESSYTPRVGVEYDYGSGDSNPTDGKHETFENLFPTNHKFYGFMDFASLQNLHAIRLTSSIKPLPRLLLTADYNNFWLADKNDNFYAVNGARRGGIAATPGTGYGINPRYDSYIGSEIDLVAAYNVSPQSVLEVGYGHFFHGNYIKQSLSAPTHGSQDADWVYIQLTVNF